MGLNKHHRKTIVSIKGNDLDWRGHSECTHLVTGPRCDLLHYPTKMTFSLLSPPRPPWKILAWGSSVGAPICCLQPRLQGPLSQQCLDIAVRIYDSKVSFGKGTFAFGTSSMSCDQNSRQREPPPPNIAVRRWQSDSITEPLHWHSYRLAPHRAHSRLFKYAYLSTTRGVNMLCHWCCPFLERARFFDVFLSEPSASRAFFPLLAWFVSSDWSKTLWLLLIIYGH